MEYCLETKDLDYYYRRNQPVLQQLNLQVPRGIIYGFLGANGAGKTTTMKLVTSLLKNQRGAIYLLETPLQYNRVNRMRSLGVMIESPSVYSHLSAREHLELFRKIYQCPPSYADEALEMVNLQHTGNKKAGHFSLGMKQRLGIATALLHKPSLLILDEPTNGLDPQGIIEMRTLLKKLNHEQNVSIIISSHLLAEMEKLVNHISIIDKGRLLYQGSLAALKNSAPAANSLTGDLESIYLNLLNITAL